MATSETDERSTKSLGVRNKTLREQVFDHLREEILSNRLTPGQELNELALSAELEVSRGPIREALGRLASEGLVKVTPRRGAVVAELTDEEFVEAYQVREALETLAIRLAVPRIEADELARLRELHEEMNEFVANDDTTEFFDANSAFHQQIVDASRNAKLGEHYRLLMAQMGRYLPRSLTLRGTIGSSPTEHAAILAAVEAGDPDEAARLLANHIEIPQRIEAGEGDAPQPALTAAEESEEQ
ncbi:MAG TPA: GntR family transcriptional regulator [Solirubrobacterales bacterium]|nr:GntR family transcriptional regulator [Solirubrobacterales bacterium]